VISAMGRAAFKTPQERMNDFCTVEWKQQLRNIFYAQLEDRGRRLRYVNPATILRILCAAGNHGTDAGGTVWVVSRGPI